MIQVRIHDGTLSVHFPSWTRLFVKAGRVDVPLEAIADVHHLDQPLTAAKGLRSGLVVSGYIKVGTWTSFGGVKRLVAAQRGVPGVRIVLRHRVAGVDELILGVQDAQEIRRRLTRVQR
ncbi:hypothetical protein [Streptosporangium amethystogenes]|uniref:hypothetical protein n=1 Tax=Streptosporangium amethystogenes TaxID=2002 RepID=UPI0004C6408E|nr:hypothetical protein [Streptosporangium amethystogenes]